MKQRIYDAVLEVLSRHTFFHSGLGELQTKFPNILDTVSVKTLRSIQAQYYVRRMKRSTGRHYNRRTREKYYQLYSFAKARGEEHVIVRLALRNDISPSLLARIILEEYYWNDVKHDRVRDKPDGSRGALPVGLITDLLRDIAKVPNPILARELYESMVLDNFYGPVIDSVKKCCGSEYEIMLTSYCLNAKLTFMDEGQMRKEGYDKTPDIKLKIPIMVNGRVVNWIESKASFGDPTNHQQYKVDQYLPYQNRFGDGAVIYWFGFVDELANSDCPGIQLWDKFPSSDLIMTLDDVLHNRDGSGGNLSSDLHPRTQLMNYSLFPKKSEGDSDSSDPLYNYVDPMFDCVEPSLMCDSSANESSGHTNCVL